MMKDLSEEWEVKLIFRGAYKLSGTGIVVCQSGRAIKLSAYILRQ